MNKAKVLVVDDSAFMRKLISDFLSEDPRLEVIGTARNGQEALRKIEELKPDVVTLDVEMPIMDGLETLKHIMQQHPLPVVMISSTTREGAENTILALQYGAVDFIAKPSGAISLDLYKIKDQIVEKVLLASHANLQCMKRKSKIPIPPQKQYSKIESNEPIKTNTTKKKIVCIGTSTGGPRALQHVLSKLPETINAPILIVQHMPKGFTKSLASRLDSICRIRVKEAEDGELIQKGTAYIAPGGQHLQVKKIGMSLAVHLDESPARNGHRPSVDVMFESLCTLADYEKIAVIMTGMGSDGTEGLKQLKASGNTKVIAESAESSVVFGMPKSAIAANVTDEVVHLDKIADAIMKYVDA
ncbi:two-component system chemotaxis response regulator CheB [Thermolongibacillus altinsuensis]|uniref:Protein-glutamate methylesterase/protein-glutamine glutaminase n=1 Tax=Thermolongibacillus altinsuensis TaxID=575256 RepID=A0A4R1QG22_9BACL|nr:chemotaxis response regulator protein-glutamate methylesterase [Thermolongibacillus altinsuensis]TCL50392.1 two-component system chemotaxis response regulator CheB [Thermolongibacillus altinsuensis]